MTDDAPPPPEPETAETAAGPRSGDSTTAPTRPGRRLPVGPVGLLVTTAIALAAATGAAWLVVRASTQDEQPVDVRTALQQTESRAPVVPAGTEAAAVGDPAPDVRLEYLDGGVQQLSEFHGTPMVLNFWSSTCAPCLSEMPDLEKAHLALGDSVVFLGIDVTDTAAAGEAMVTRTGVTYRNARDPGAEVMAAFGGTALPRTVILGADGKVIDTHTGTLTSADLTALLKRHGLAGE